MKTGKVMYSAKEISEIMGIGRDAAYDLLHSKQFPTIRVGRKILVHREVLTAFLKGERAV